MFLGLNKMIFWKPESNLYGYRTRNTDVLGKIKHPFGYRTESIKKNTHSNTWVLQNLVICWTALALVRE